MKFDQRSRVIYIPKYTLQDYKRLEPYKTASEMENISNFIYTTPLLRRLAPEIKVGIF